MNMEEKLTNLIVFWNMKEKAVMNQMETDAFSNIKIISSKKILPKNISNSYNHIKKHVMTRCRFPDFCERYKIDIGIYDVKRKSILPRAVKERIICSYIHKNHHCIIWKKNRKDALLNVVEELERKFKYVKNEI